MIELVIDRTTEGEPRAGLERALILKLDLPVEEAAGVLGDGSRIANPDSVPFAPWCAARRIDDFAEALWTTVSEGATSTPIVPSSTGSPVCGRRKATSHEGDRADFHPGRTDMAGLLEAAP